MALNITLAGNIKDSSGTSIDANVQVLVYNSNNNLKKWSDIRLTEDTDYNINIGDPDLSGQENTLGITDSLGEYALIAVWTGSDDRMTPASEFAFIFHELEGNEVYVQDIQLGFPDIIGCSNWSINEYVNTGETVIANNNNTNEFTYEALGTTHYLYKRYFNEDIFSYMGTCSVEYDFGDGYSISNVYTPGTGGTFTTYIKVNDCFGNSVECHKDTKVYYDITPCFDITPTNIHLGSEVSINECITGTPGAIDQISKIEYIYSDNYDNGVIIGSGPLTITQKVTFWNGYEDKTKEITKTYELENIPPEIDLETIPSEETEQEYTFKHNGTDVDGYIERVKWEIWRNNPDSDGNDNWSLYYSTGELTDLSDWTFDFSDIIGELKVTATVYDNNSASASQEYLIDNACDTAPILCFDNIDWNKKVNTIDFSLNRTSNIWTVQTIKIPWKVNTIKIPWDLNIVKKDFSPIIKKIDFKYKLTDIGRPGIL